MQYWASIVLPIHPGHLFEVTVFGMDNFFAEGVD
jgi:hypothetical protein